MTIAVTRSGEPETKPSRASGSAGSAVAGSTAAGSVAGGTAPGGSAPGAASRVPDGTVQYVRIGDLLLESGIPLPDVVLAYETWGTLNADASNAVLIEHALTGDTHVTRGASEEPGWWEQLVGPGAPVDTDRYFVVVDQHPGRLLRLHRPVHSGPGRAPAGDRAFRSSRIRDTTAPRRAWPTPWASAAGTPCVGGSHGRRPRP